ncbi:Hypothetical predicted protein [Mytilus galloprovincialis]|uniref:Uncharacterized protein n=1 Tax=Mytilus galloprovincialis TaxID=29158 RepID=A0A8B6DPQ6_MYTGA|nr:Hypothetical predicted protein [Mytilus galloprovincialis]
MFSCHAPLSVELYLNVDRKINDQCTCVKSVYNRVKWNEGFKDGLVNDMLTNVQKFDDLMLNLTEHENDIDKCVGDLNNLLTEICEQYTKTEVEFTDYCEHCIDSNANKSRKSFVKIDKPWISEDCKNLYRQYKLALNIFNANHSNDNRIRLNLAKQKYKCTETKLKRHYKNQQGNMLKNLRRKNPKKFYQKFKRPKTENGHKITLEQFQKHFKNLMSNNTETDKATNTETLPNVHEELDIPFTDTELEKCLRKLKYDKSTGFDNIMNEYLIAGKLYLFQYCANFLIIFLIPEISLKYGLTVLSYLFLKKET